MPFPKQKFREILFQVLYSYQFNEEILEELPSFQMEKLDVPKKILLHIQSKIRSMIPYFSEIDQLIEKYTPGYDTKRISPVEKNILRIGIFELLYDEEIPPKVAITEGMRIARKYSAPEAGSFINAILDAIYQQHHQSLAKV